jgi:hypothetical protein
MYAERGTSALVTTDAEPLRELTRAGYHADDFDYRAASHVPSPITALSPDGARLAIAQPDGIAVIHLPNRQSAQHCSLPRDDGKAHAAFPWWRSRYS